MAHPSVWPPLPPGSWILLHAPQVSYSQFHPVNRSRTHMLISQVPYNSMSPQLPTLLLCLLGTSAQSHHLLLAEGTTWGLQVKYTPRLFTMDWEKIHTLFCPTANAAMHVCLWLEVSLQHLELSPSPALFSLTVNDFQDAHCSCHSGLWWRPPPTMFKERFNKEDRANFIDQAQGVFRQVTSKPVPFIIVSVYPLSCFSPNPFH